jgi:REP element-mobilizing transposase RayT
MDLDSKHDWLRRLPDGFYRGFSTVHWQMTIQDRVTGWLKPGFHPRFRELLLHTLARFDLVCPIYCLMPDHLHLLWMGVAETAEQKKAAKFFREQVNALLDRCQPGTRFQAQAYDHVLRQHEKGADAVREMAHYIEQNPVRAGLVKHPRQWPYLGCMVTGYPKLHPLDEGYWEKFWRLRAAMMENRAVRRGEGAFPDSSESSAC